jgi:hypothetical protein
MTKQAPTLTMDHIPQRMPGESNRAYWRRWMAFISGEDVRTRTDLADFKTADFHLDRYPEKSR